MHYLRNQTENYCAEAKHRAERERGGGWGRREEEKTVDRCVCEQAGGGREKGGFTCMDILPNRKEPKTVMDWGDAWVSWEFGSEILAQYICICIPQRKWVYTCCRLRGDGKWRRWCSIDGQKPTGKRKLIDYYLQDNEYFIFFSSCIHTSCLNVRF